MIYCNKAAECNEKCNKCNKNKKAETLEKSKISAHKIKLATGIEPVTSSLPMKCATDCAMPAYSLFNKMSITYYIYNCNNLFKKIGICDG